MLCQATLKLDWCSGFVFWEVVNPSSMGRAVDLPTEWGSWFPRELSGPTTFPGGLGW